MDLGGRRIPGNDLQPVSVQATVPFRLLSRVAVVILLSLGALNLLIGWLKFIDIEDDEQPLRVLIYLFDLGGEKNVTAWFAGLLLFSAALAALVASQAESTSEQRRGFRITAGVLTYMSLDEATELHERASEPLRDSLDIGGIFYWAWVLPGIAAVLLVVGVLFRFVQRLPAPTRTYVFASGGLFAACALGLEFLEGYAFDANDQAPNVITDVLSMIEELGEMIAVMLFTWAVLTHAERSTHRS